MSFMNLPIPNLVIDAGSLIVLLIIILGISLQVERRCAAITSFTGRFSLKERQRKPLNPIPRPKSFQASLLFCFAKSLRSAFSKLAARQNAFRILPFSGALSSLEYPLLLRSSQIRLTSCYRSTIRSSVWQRGRSARRYRFSRNVLCQVPEGAPIWRLTRSDVFLMTLFLAVVTGFVAQQTIYSSMGSEWVSTVLDSHGICDNTARDRPHLPNSSMRSQNQFLSFTKI